MKRAAYAGLLEAFRHHTQRPATVRVFHQAPAIPSPTASNTWSSEPVTYGELYTRQSAQLHDALIRTSREYEEASLREYLGRSDVDEVVLIVGISADYYLQSVHGGERSTGDEAYEGEDAEYDAPAVSLAVPRRRLQARVRRAGKATPLLALTDEELDEATTVDG